MEEAEGEEELPVLARFGAVAQGLVVKIGVGTKQVGSETGWGLHGHLDGSLQHTYGERWTWHGGQPDSELWVVFLGQLFDNGLKSGHPGNRQMTVLK